MNIVGALAAAQARLPHPLEEGYVSSRISLIVEIDRRGRLVGVQPQTPGGSRDGTLMMVPQPARRSRNIAPAFLWGNTAYALGVSARRRAPLRVSQEHAAFRSYHHQMLQGSPDEGLRAILRFFDQWVPSAFHWPSEWSGNRDPTLVFALADHGDDARLLHQRSAARAIWERRPAANEMPRAACLVTGNRQPIVRIHPAIRGVVGAHPAGASLISFNREAFASYGHAQGENAPVSRAVASRYAAALSHLLEPDRGHRVQWADASVVFWAEGNSEDAQAATERAMAAMLGDGIGGGEAIARRWTGDPLERVLVRVLGLAPNASRIMVRFWFEGEWADLIRNHDQFRREVAVEPTSTATPALRRYLEELSPHGHRDTVPAAMAASWMRAVLAGEPYPGALLALLLMRIRTDGWVNRRRVGMLRALALRRFGLSDNETPASLDPDNTAVGYRLGRLFASQDRLRILAGGVRPGQMQGTQYAAASSRPAHMMPVLQRASRHHQGRLPSERASEGAALLRMIEDTRRPLVEAGAVPDALPPLQQALFALGFYHQRAALSARLGDREDASA